MIGLPAKNGGRFMMQIKSIGPLSGHICVAGYLCPRRRV